MVADLLGENRSTARCILSRHISEGRVQERLRGRGTQNESGRRYKAMPIRRSIIDNCMLTLSEINIELRRRLPRKPQRHDRTVGRALDRMLVSLKLARPLPIHRNRPDVIQSRFECANWFLNSGMVGHCFFKDECSFIWTIST